MILAALVLLAVGAILVLGVGVRAINSRVGVVSVNPVPFRIHYSWVIVGVLAVVQIFGSSIFFVAGVMVAPLSDENGGFGWNVGVIGAGIACYYLFSAIYAPISGNLGDRYGARRMMLAGIVMYGVGMVALGFVTHIWQFFLFYSVFMSATASITMVPLMASITGWFRRRLGIGIGILWAVGGIGTAILAPLIADMFDVVGWRNTFVFLGLAGSGIMLLLWPLIRSKPADIGILPYGTLDTDPKTAPMSPSVMKLRLKVFNQHMRGTHAFWDLPLIHGLGCAGHGIVLIFVVPMAVERGIDLTTAAYILSILSLVSILSRLGAPILAEIHGPKKLMLASLLIQGITVPILFVANDPWVFYVFAVVFGFGFGGEWTSYLEINRRYFGDGPMGGAYGWQMTGAMVGHAVTTALAGLVLVATGGSYNTVFALSAAFSLIGVVVITLLDPTDHVLIPNWEDSLPPEARSSHYIPPTAEDAPGPEPGTATGPAVAGGED
ncbi:MAG TPA: MFS transporter [Dehalococcoidia bacterium]|nr:MFS transporter [Dehalococcoidia bacterium]